MVVVDPYILVFGFPRSDPRIAGNSERVSDLDGLSLLTWIDVLCIL